MREEWIQVYQQDDIVGGLSGRPPVLTPYFIKASDIDIEAVVDARLGDASYYTCPHCGGKRDPQTSVCPCKRTSWCTVEWPAEPDCPRDPMGDFYIEKGPQAEGEAPKTGRGEHITGVDTASHEKRSAEFVKDVGELVEAQTKLEEIREVEKATRDGHGVFEAEGDVKIVLAKVRAHLEKA